MVATPWLWALDAMTAGSNLSFLLWPPSLPGGGRRRGAARPKNPQAPAWGFWFGWPRGAEGPPGPPNAAAPLQP